MRRTFFILCLHFYFFQTSIAVEAAPQASAPTPLAHWKLDGTALDSGSEGWQGKNVGRIEFLASPIGGGGQLLSLNGVDAYVQVDDPAAGDFGDRDFSVSFWILPLELRWAGMVQRGDPKPGWSIYSDPTGAVHFTATTAAEAKIDLKTPAGALQSGTWTHVALVVRRTGSSPGALLYLDGVAAASTGAGAGAILAPSPLMIGKGDGPGSYVDGLMDDVRLYSAALEEQQVAALTDAGLPWRRPKPWTKQANGGHVQMHENEVLVFAGGENMLVRQQSGELATRLCLATSSKSLYLRNMAWEGDTVFEQWRVLNFGNWAYQLRRVGATTIIADFGQMESLRGNASLHDFTAAYDKLLDEWSAITRQIVLLSPVPFESPPSPLPDLSTRNRELRVYVESIRRIAREHDLAFVDLFTAAEARTQGGQSLTRDGVHLTAEGEVWTAREIIRQLKLNDSASSGQDDSARLFEFPAVQALREAFVRQDALWRRYWRPGNWAFLNGDRVSQPSSRDVHDPRVRWYPAEVQEFGAMVDRQDREIHSLANKAAEGGK